MTITVDDPRVQAVLARVREIPEGHVTTYGELLPGHARFAGSILSRLDEPGLPWHRVVRADGSLAVGERQRVLLDAEGVPFRGARVDMQAAWVPAER
ncbi:MAG TPA: MGMT family protein [Thermoleophilaceae bacterium]|nr:MGMT family protein [Thermoleophilaceae bacterium]